MGIQSQQQIADNTLVVMSVVPWSGDPSRNIVTFQALIPGTNTNGVKVGQSYLLPDATLTSNNNGGLLIGPGPAAFPLGR